MIALAVLTAACGSTGLTPAAYPDSTVPCPAGFGVWKLEVFDRRVRRESSEGVQSLVSESIRRSFPGCRWDTDGSEKAARVVIEIHRFVSEPEGNTWEAAADWSVVVSDPSGRTLSEFEADEEVSRPNYRGSNNAKESLREAFDRAMRKTLAGLRAVSSAGAACLPGRTPPRRTATAPDVATVSSSWLDRTSDPGGSARPAPGLERFSHPESTEAL
ncbi:MAG TPA: hypothetical protein VGK86_12960 [Thermoanaerobaculia bacterium]